MNARRASWIIAIAIAGFALWTITRLSGPAAQIEFSGSTMGTTYVVKVVAAPMDQTEAELRARVEAALRRVDSLMSTYDPSSELSRFNLYAGEDWFPVSVETLTVVAAAIEISALSGGAFDVTVGPLVNLWGFGPDGPIGELPPDSAIARSLRRVGYQKLATHNDPPALRKSHADLYLDLSAIAKGYAVDQAGRALSATGVDNYLVEVGGEIMAHGHNANGNLWRVAVEQPLAGERSVQRVLQLHNTAIATSGDYRNFFEFGDRRYSHSIDPRTGRPVPYALASVSVLEPSAMRADALATTLMIMGPEAALVFADRDHIAGVLIVKTGDEFEERQTAQLRSYLAGGDRP